MQQHSPDMSIFYRTAKHLQPALVLAACMVSGGWVHAQNFPITGEQRAKANEVAQSGVPVGELAENAPDSYTVKSGDTLWRISGLFLKSPWRWPDLWGMNLKDIANPHRIYPGQQLFLIKKDGRAMLSTSQGAASNTEAVIGPNGTVKLSPRTRGEALSASALPTIEPHLIEPFLSEPLIVSEAELNQTPRIVATQEGRVLLSPGDRAYARGPADAPLLDTGVGPTPQFRIFRNATPLKHPDTGVILGYEAQYVGKATLARGEAAQVLTEPAAANDGSTWSSIKSFVRNHLPGNNRVTELAVPATIDIIFAKEEMRVGDRLVPEPKQELRQYVPAAPQSKVDGRIVSVYGSGVAYAAQNQVVVISVGSEDGIRTGDVLALLKNGAVMQDRTAPGKPNIKLPNERNGLVMVFRPFAKLSYALILDVADGAKVGDRVTNPR